MDVASLTPRIREILQMSDLSTVSAKKVRRQLENELNTSLDGLKAEIDDIIKQQFQQLHSEQQQRQHAQQQYTQQYVQQGAMGNVYGAPPMGLQVPGYGTVNPPLVPGAVPGAQPDAAPRKRGRPRKAENEKKLQRKKQRDLDPDRPKRQTGLSKPMKLSPVMAEFLDQKYCARVNVVQKLWKYIKLHELQDPTDKRYIMCDDKLKALFNTERLYMYTMSKLLNDHLIKPTPEENAEAMVLLDLPPTHPAAADSAPQPSASGSVAPESPATTDADEPARSESEAKPENESKPEKPEHEFKPIKPESDSVKFEPETQPVKSEPLALPPMPASVNNANGANGANNA
ncbi:hypothetical protein IWW50_005476 [Coemansia erecta]|nr:hypothetical protein GGF43_004989 [Coemansia sp. RSA 2618]KAJ2819377.1 hypothetical protein IWW50_005476 [Coemansia erecta]